MDIPGSPSQSYPLEGGSKGYADRQGIASPATVMSRRIQEPSMFSRSKDPRSHKQSRSQTPDYSPASRKSPHAGGFPGSQSERFERLERTAPRFGPGTRVTPVKYSPFTSRPGTPGKDSPLLHPRQEHALRTAIKAANRANHSSGKAPPGSPSPGPSPGGLAAQRSTPSLAKRPLLFDSDPMPSNMPSYFHRPGSPTAPDAGRPQNLTPWLPHSSPSQPSVGGGTLPPHSTKQTPQHKGAATISPRAKGPHKARKGGSPRVAVSESMARLHTAQTKWDELGAFIAGEKAGDGALVLDDTFFDLLPLPNFKDISFRSDAVGHGLPSKFLSPAEYSDFVMPPSKIDEERPSIAADGEGLPEPVIQAEDPARPRSGRPTDFDALPGLFSDKSTRDWYKLTFQDRNLAGRQDVYTLVNWMQVEMTQSIKEHLDQKAKQQAAEEERSKAEDATIAPQYAPDPAESSFLDRQIRIFSSVAHELCRQISTHCVERGRLMAYLWQSLMEFLVDARGRSERLMHELSVVDRTMADLERKAWEHNASTRQAHQHNLEQLASIRKAYMSQSMEASSVLAEKEKLEEWRRENEQTSHLDTISQLQDTVLELRKQLAAARVDAGNKEQEAMFVQEQLAASTKELQELKRVNEAHMKEQAQLTPRVPRKYGVIAEELSASQVETLDEALSQGMKLEALLHLMAEERLQPYVDKYLGHLQHHPGASWHKLVHLLTKQAWQELESHVDALTTKVAGNMLHKGLSIADVATVLTGKDADGFDVRKVAPLVGAFKQWAADPDKMSQLRHTLRRAAVPTAERYRAMENECRDLKEDRAKRERHLEMLEAERKEYQDMVKEKMERMKAHKKKSLVEVFVETEQGSEFEGFGLGLEVPKCLKFLGKLPNHRLAKKETEGMVKEIWAAKKLEDAGQGELSSMEDFLYVFLERKVTREVEGEDGALSPEEAKEIPALIAERSYNFVHGLHLHKYDADCELFLEILMGHIDEDVYRSVQALQDEVMQICVNADKLLHDDEVTGRLPKRDLIKHLEAHFEGKKEPQRKAILATLDEEQPSRTIVDYLDLFAEDENFNQGPFLEEIKDQALQERLDFLAELEIIFYKMADMDHKLSEEAARKAFKSFDPDIPSQKLQHYVDRVFANSGADTKISKNAKVDVQDAMKRMQKGVLNKTGKVKASMIATKLAMSLNGFTSPGGSRPNSGLSGLSGSTSQL